MKNPELVPVRGAKSCLAFRSAECTAVLGRSYIAPATSLAISYPKKTAVAKQAAAGKTRLAVTACGMPQPPARSSERCYFDFVGFHLTPAG